MKSFVAMCLVGALVAVQSANGFPQDAPKPPPKKSDPTYFVAPAGVEDAAACKAHHAANAADAITGPIFTASGETTICIFFAEHDIWRRDTGTQGNCRGSCCEWFPPAAKDGTPAIKSPAPTISWFASTDGTCDNVAAGEVTPWIFNKSPAGEYKVCMKPGTTAPTELQKYFLVPVETSKCGGKDGNCCPFAFPKGFVPPFAHEPEKAAAPAPASA